MAKIRIVIDTSTLRNDPRLSGGPMEALARFAEQAYVEILIPDVVAEEFTTLPSAKIESMIELRKTLRNLRQTTPNDLHKDILDFEVKINEAFERIENSAKERFGQWISRTGGKIIKSGHDHAGKVLKKYFAGTPPFKSVKARMDFPDAFIVETVLDLSVDDPLLVIANDKGLAAALENHQNISVFKNVRDLLESDIFDEQLAVLGIDRDSEYEAVNVERVVAAFLQNKELFRDTIEDDISRLTTGRTVSYRNPHYDEKDGSDQLYIESVESVEEFTFDGDSDYLGEGVILINFNARLEISADDFGDNDYYDDSGAHDSTREVTVMGALSVQMDRSQLTSLPLLWTTARLQEVASVSVDELDVSVVSRDY